MTKHITNLIYREHGLFRTLQKAQHFGLLKIPQIGWSGANQQYQNAMSLSASFLIILINYIAHFFTDLLNSSSVFFIRRV
jgi:hypothetical protein